MLYAFTVFFAVLLKRYFSLDTWLHIFYFSISINPKYGKLIKEYKSYVRVVQPY